MQYRSSQDKPSVVACRYCGCQPATRSAYCRARRSYPVIAGVAFVVRPPEPHPPLTCEDCEASLSALYKTSMEILTRRTR
jgi:hypothetical protein